MGLCVKRRRLHIEGPPHMNCLFNERRKGMNHNTEAVTSMEDWRKSKRWERRDRIPRERHAEAFVSAPHLERKNGGRRTKQSCAHRFFYPPYLLRPTTDESEAIWGNYPLILLNLTIMVYCMSMIFFRSEKKIYKINPPTWNMYIYIKFQPFWIKNIKSRWWLLFSFSIY